jgi:hypothetical protein
VFYSAAAKTLVEHGEVCAKCGGRLAIEDGPGPLAAAGRPVGEGNGDDA